MGFSPEQIGRMSWFQYAACIDGWNRAQRGNEPPPPSADEFEAAKEAHGDA